MARITKVKPYLTATEVKEKISTTKKNSKIKKWLVIYNAIINPREAKEIALCVGFARGTVNQIISKYNRLGPVSIENSENMIRNKAYMNLEEERSVLQPFIEAAQKGEIATTAVIQSAFEQKIGKEVDPSTIYRMLGRHKWRKVVPRSYHPKSNKEEQKLFKKLP